MSSRVNATRIDVVDYDSPYILEDGVYYSRRYFLLAEVEPSAEESARGVLRLQFGHFYSFATKGEAEALKHLVEERSNLIDLDHWNQLETVRRQEIPDWATPEFAYRERHGLPL